MTIYVTFVMLVLFLCIMDYQSTHGYIDENGKRIRRNRLYMLLVTICFLFVGGFRYYVGSDFGAYYKLKGTLTECITKLISFDEPGIVFLSYICRNIWDEGIFVIFVENALIFFLVLRGLKAHRVKDYTMPLLLYIFYGGWLFSLNGVRQAIAISIIFAFSNKNESYFLLKNIVVIFVAFLFHKSAIFMLPVIFLANRKITFVQIVGLIVFSLLLPAMGEYAMNYMGVSYTTDLYMTNDINPYRIAVAFAPILLVGVLYLSRHFDFFNQFYFVTNMVILNAIITLSTSGSAYLNRFSMYTSIYTILFLPKIKERLTLGSRKIFNSVVIMLYFVYFLFEVNNTGTCLPFQWSFSHFGEW